MKHSRQHIIPASYLQAWCDPSTPQGQTPYVWVFSKDGSEHRKRAPEKLFTERDMYTLTTSDGKRDLTLEYNFARLESEFTKLRRNKLNKRKQLSTYEHLILCMFVVAMRTRTRPYRDHWGSQWKRLLDVAEQMQQKLDAMEPEARERAILALSHDAPPDEEESASMEDVRMAAEQPLQTSLSGVIPKVAPLLMKIPFVIMETNLELGFITSDAPCSWLDLAVNQKRKPPNFGGLLSPTIQIMLPLSPTQMVLFGRKLVVSGAYVPITDEDTLDGLNKQTRLGADQEFVVNLPVVHRNWF